MDMDTLGRLVTNSIPAVKRTGITALDFAPGYVKLMLPLKGNENHVNMMYAGSLFSLAELPGGAVFLSQFDTQKYYPIVAEVTIKYLKPALTDVTLEASLSDSEVKRIQSELKECGKSYYEMELEIKDANDVIVAAAKGRYQARSF